MNKNFLLIICLNEILNCYYWLVLWNFMFERECFKTCELNILIKHLNIYNSYPCIVIWGLLFTVRRQFVIQEQYCCHNNYNSSFRIRINWIHWQIWDIELNVLNLFVLNLLSFVILNNRIVISTIPNGTTVQIECEYTHMLSGSNHLFIFKNFNIFSTDWKLSEVSFKVSSLKWNLSNNDVSFKMRMHVNEMSLIEYWPFVLFLLSMLSEWYKTVTSFNQAMWLDFETLSKLLAKSFTVFQRKTPLNLLKFEYYLL